MFEGEFDGQFIFFSEVWAALNKLLRGHEPWQPPSSHGIHVKKKAKMRHTWRSALVLYRLRFEGGQTISKRMQINLFEVTADLNVFALNQGHFRVPLDGK